MWKIFRYSFFDLIRSRWSVIYLMFYLVLTFTLLYFTQDLSRAAVSLMNIILLLSPLIGMLFGVIFYYHSREFVELLLAQPIRRKQVFLGQYLGLSVSLSASFLLGVGIPFLIFGVHNEGLGGHFPALLFTGVCLTAVFVGLAYLIAIRFEDRIKGFGMAMVVWLLLAVIYDGLFLLFLMLFEAYPLEKFALAATLFNPIDLSRILIMIQMDISALLGYTGAVFTKFLGTALGTGLAMGCLMIWIVLPVWGMLRAANRKDF